MCPKEACSLGSIQKRLEPREPGCLIGPSLQNRLAEKAIEVGGCAVTRAESHTDGQTEVGLNSGVRLAGFSSKRITSGLPVIQLECTGVPITICKEWWPRDRQTGYAYSDPRAARGSATSRIAILAGFSYRRFPQLSGFFSAAPFLARTASQCPKH